MRLVVVAMVVVACKQPSSLLGDATTTGGEDAVTAGGQRDAPAGALDAHISDARPIDARPIDARPIDARPIDGAASDASSGDASATEPPDFGSFTPETHALGMNDISFLLQLPADPVHAPTFVTMTGFTANADLVPRSTFAQVAGSGEVVAPFEQFHVVAFRFDLCDRAVPGPCPTDVDGQLRLTFQPLLATTPTTAADVALHASYRVPAVDLPYVVNELRALSRLRGLPISRPLLVDQSITPGATTEYVSRLRALVKPLARADRLIRLTVFEQPANVAPFEWHLSIIERVNGTLQYVPLSGINISWLEQDIHPEGVVSFSPSPIADIPAGFEMVLDEQGFAAASSATQMQALEAITEDLDPTRTTLKTVECAGCHVATLVQLARASTAHVNVKNIPGEFTSTHDLSINAGNSATDRVSLRAFGWRDSTPEISQRVANDTAMVLDEIEARFPPP